MRSFRKTAAAFTLLEVLISMLIFSIGALGVLAMVTTTLQLNQNSRQTTEATQLAIRQMERLQLLPNIPVPAEFTSCPMATRCYLTGSLGISTTEATMRPTDLLGSTSGSGLYYEVTWRVSATTPRYMEVVVYWPKNRDLAGGDWSGAGLDCANTNACYSVPMYSYHN